MFFDGGDGPFHSPVNVARAELPLEDALVFKPDNVPREEVPAGMVSVLCLFFTICFTLFSGFQLRLSSGGIG
jgi:hypothetical protein